jgi:predicted DNA-binding transcriptional regulator YafY
VNRTERLYAIAEELRAAGPAGRTSGWLARRFEVSGRTVKRDVDALLQAGVPVWAQSGPGGGYVLDTAATLPPLNVTAAEAAAIAVALAALPALPFAADARSALSKVLAAMPDAERARARDVAGRLWVRTPAGGRPAVARVLDEAVRERRVVVLRHTGATGAVTERAVEPVALAATGGHWHLLAWCRLRAAPRWFRTDRITAAHLTAEEAPAHDAATLFGTPPPDAHPVELR